jgi:hypothetical protein
MAGTRRMQDDDRNSKEKFCKYLSLQSAQTVSASIQWNCCIERWIIDISRQQSEVWFLCGKLRTQCPLTATVYILMPFDISLWHLELAAVRYPLDQWNLLIENLPRGLKVYMAPVTWTAVRALKVFGIFTEIASRFEKSIIMSNEGKVPAAKSLHYHSTEFWASVGSPSLTKTHRPFLR